MLGKAMSKELKNDVAELPFEKALAELETIVQRLEKGDVALEESIQIYERGASHAAARGARQNRRDRRCAAR